MRHSAGHCYADCHKQALYAERNCAMLSVVVLSALLWPPCLMKWSGNTKGGRITVPLTSCWTGLESAVWQLTIFVFIRKTDYSKLVQQEVNSTVILPPLVFPGLIMGKLSLTRQNLGRLFNSNSGRLLSIHLLHSIPKRPNLELKTWPKQLLGSLPLDIALTDDWKLMVRRFERLGIFC